MPEIVRKVLALLSLRDRRNAYFLFVMVLAMAFLDVVGIASIMPFMAVLANPEAVQNNEALGAVYRWLGLSDPEQYLFFLGLVVFVAMVVSIGFKALTTWTITRFTQMQSYSISRRLISGYLTQPYEWYLNRHSAELGKTILSEVEMVVNGSVVPLMRLIAQGTVIFAVLTLLVAVDPWIALVAGGSMGSAYGLTYVALRKFLDRVGLKRLIANKMRFRAVSEAFGGIKEIKLAGLEEGALNRFDVPARTFARTRVTAQVVGMMPRFALEIVAFGGLLLLTLYLLSSGDGLQEALPIIALYAIAGNRLMPALQSAYNDATHLRFSSGALDQLHQDLSEQSDDCLAISPQHFTLVPRREIRLEGITYSYPNASIPAVEDVSLIIPVQSTIGFVGGTGSGKTTTVDIILGLLVPQEGTIWVDETAIVSANRRAWQRTLGYVPQQIFLADESVAANIAFGVPKDQIDQRAVERAARIANLHNFVVEGLSHGYATEVGERGVRLSGGQRQRIGIARALYHNPAVLILDEATSALDNLTEVAVLEAVHKLAGELTIVLIAHRLSTVRNCDRIFLLDRGKLAGDGTYDELVANNASFRSMARI